MKITIIVLIAFFSGIIWFNENKGESEIYLIPEGYQGEVVVFFGVENGKRGTI